MEDNPPKIDEQTAAIGDTAAPIRLLLSGGGFRATLFHLGIVRYLVERGQIDRVKEVFSVSGGSILAGYLGLNWTAVRNIELFPLVASEIVAFTQRDVRGRILRRALAYWGAVLSLLASVLTLFGFAAITNRITWYLVAGLTLTIVFLVLLRERFSLVKLFDAELAKFLQPAGQTARMQRAALLKDLPNAKEETLPNFFILATNLTSGSMWAFVRQGAWMIEDRLLLLSHELMRLSTAVAASAAFPPLFSPVRIPRTYDPNSLPVDQFLADGGVYDNLGIAAAHSLAGISQTDSEEDVAPKLVVSCSAERLFERNSTDTFWFLAKRAARSTDIQMTRISELQTEGMDAVAVKLGTDDESVSEVIPIETQRLIRNIRTDLNRFSAIEIQLLYFKGYLSAWLALDKEQLPRDDFNYSAFGVPLVTNNNHRWLPCDSSQLNDADDLEVAFKDSHRIRVSWFSGGDWWGSLLLACSAALLLGLNPITWWLASAIWGHMPGWPAAPQGEFYAIGRTLPKGCSDIVGFLRPFCIRLHADDRDGELFISEPLAKAYGWGPRGAFRCRFEKPDRNLPRICAFLVDSEGHLEYLPNHETSNEYQLLFNIPADRGTSRIVIAPARFAAQAGATAEPTATLTIDSSKPEDSI